ncbi:hypothetical protein ASE04_29500 [Rhizobium sp. Root708]|nr:hypothetical protein ASE04_29500 [Rhizobium sp. Root708]
MGELALPSERAFLLGNCEDGGPLYLEPLEEIFEAPSLRGVGGSCQMLATAEAFQVTGTRRRDEIGGACSVG